MKKIIVPTFLILFNFNYSFGQGKTFFDIKTKGNEKHKFVHIQTLLEYKLIRSDWANVAEIGEEFEVWLKNYERNIGADILTMKLDLKVIEKENNKVVLNKKNFSITTFIKRDNKKVNSKFEHYKNFLGEISDELKLEAETVSDNILIELEKLNKQTN